MLELKQSTAPLFQIHGDLIPVPGPLSKKPQDKKLMNPAAESLYVEWLVAHSD